MRVVLRKKFKNGEIKSERNHFYLKRIRRQEKRSMKSLVLVLSIVLCVNGKKAFRHGSKVELEAQKKLEAQLEAFHAMGGDDGDDDDE